MTRISSRTRRVLLMVGTRKGAFLLRSDGRRRTWKQTSPVLSDWQVFHITGDSRSGRTRLFAACKGLFGNDVCWSDNLGKDWVAPQKGAKFAKSRKMTVTAPWVVQPGRADEPSVVYVGVDPAALFRSEDGGQTYQEVRSLTDHPTRKKHWMPGFGGLCLHTILLDPTDEKRMYVAISTGGVFRTTDGGKSWAPANKGTVASFLPDKRPEVGQCVHHVVLDPHNPRRLYQQNHCGVYRSDNGASRWINIGRGLPSDFGFPIVIHPQKKDTLYVVPLISAEQRWTVGAKMGVFRSTNAGKTWKRLSKGLPQQQAYMNVLRLAMAVDDCDRPGLYVGTTDGTVYCSLDDGDSWSTVATHLPYVLSVEAMTV